MPHYWFKIPLDGTAPHLKQAKAQGGGPGVKRELRKDAQSRNKSLADALFAPGLSSVDAAVYSEDELSEEECNWFHERWDTGERGCPEPRFAADETVLEPDSGWIRDPGTAD
jgi:hypothetical protein